jgi:hypothetical protein
MPLRKDMISGAILAFGWDMKKLVLFDSKEITYGF